MKHKLGPYAYLDEGKNKVAFIDNKIKHQGYNPTQSEAINAIGIMEEIYRKLKDEKIEVPEDVQLKIYQNLYS